MYKAVFIDMDGTLLRNDHTLSDNNKKALLKLLSMGVMVVPISARPLHGILPITGLVIPASMPVVSLNGSYIFHNKEVIYQAGIDLPVVTALYEELSVTDVAVMYYSQMDWFATSEHSLITKEQDITDIKIKIQPFAQTFSEWAAKNVGPNKLLIAGDSDLITLVEQKLLKKYRSTLNIYKSQPCYLEVMHLDASKTKAIEFLLERYGIHQQEIIAIGDNYNDKGMIEFAGMGVAMGNAPDEIKMAANYVTDTNEQDGVAKALNHFFK